MTDPPFVPYSIPVLPEAEMRLRGQIFCDLMSRRRSVRHFSSKPVPKELIELAILTAGTSPSGAHRQPWKFVAVSDSELKTRIRIAAEEEERESYEHRMPPEWLAAIEPMGTDWQKPYLETVPWIVVVFEETFGIDANGESIKNYYVKESVGMACGLFAAALHNMGLATLTHTPSPMQFLTEILGRPENEKPYILFPIGYPADDAVVPNLQRKSLEDLAVWNPET